MHSLRFSIKAQINLEKNVSVKKLHCAALIHYLKRWMACLNILKIAPDSLVRLATGVIPKPPVLEHVHKRKKSMSCVITASVPTNDHTQIRFCTLWVCNQQDYSVGPCIIPCAFFGKSVKHTCLCRKMYSVQEKICLQFFFCVLTSQ